MRKFIKVDLENGKHVCKPTRTEVKPGDSVEWNGGVIVFFPDATPFREGRGPFSPGDPQTVDKIPPLKKGDTFTFVTLVNGTVKPTVGDIVVT